MSPYAESPEPRIQALPPGDPVDLSFFSRPPWQAAPLLLGKILSRRTEAGLISVRIVETEAYSADDPASHSFGGETARNRSMFREGGCLYIYLIYGIHLCLNLVTQPEGEGSAVLIRAGEPLAGQALMWKNRYPGRPFRDTDFYREDTPGRGYSREIRGLTSGPGKLCSALGISRGEHDGLILNRGDIFLTDDGCRVRPADISCGVRIGITKGADKPWRWVLKGNPFLSRP